MKNTVTNNLEFKSKIYVVSPNAFTHVKMRLKKNSECQNIDNWYLRPELDVEDFNGEKYWYAYRQNVECGYTEGVRTCTGGISINKGNNATLFWHILNSETNNKNLSIITDKIQGTNVFMLGGKNKSPYSLPNFETIYYNIVSKKIPITALKDLLPCWEAHFAYESAKDTIYLCVNNIVRKYAYVQNKSKLHEVFRFIKISPSDNIKFLTQMEENLMKLFKRI